MLSCVVLLESETEVAMEDMYEGWMSIHEDR